MGEMIRPQAEQRDHLTGGDERVGDHALVRQCQRGHRVTVKRPQEHRTVQLRSLIEGGKPPDEVALRDGGESQLDTMGGARTGTPVLRPLRGCPSQIGHVFASDLCIDRGVHDAFLSFGIGASWP
jgi:hypothetical protein